MTNQQEYIQDDEITLKELILKVGEFWRELWKNWWVIGLIAIPIVVYMVYKAATADRTYEAELTFMVNKDEGGGMSAISGILGTFGLGGGSQGEYNLDKMLQLLKSRNITEKVIFSEVEIENNKDLLANHLIHHLDTLELWFREPSILNKKPDNLKGFKFTHDSTANFTNLENKAVQRIKGRMLGNEDNPGFLTSGYNEDSGILNIKCKTQHEELSIELVKNYYQELSTFYTEKTVGGHQLTYNLLKIKSDSIYDALSATEFQLASLIESSRGVYSERENLRKNRLNREIQKLSIMYGETAKNLEIADFTLKSKTPFITLIDEPISPIKPESESIFKALVIGGLLGAFLGALFIISRKIYRDTMASA